MIDKPAKQSETVGAFPLALDHRHLAGEPLSQGDTSLDIPEPQVVRFFPQDPIPYHHRVLLRQVQGSRWVVLMPDLDLEIEDLSEYTVRALGRAAPFPSGFGQVYAFDPVDDGVWLSLRAEARLPKRPTDDRPFGRLTFRERVEALLVGSEDCHRPCGSSPDKYTRRSSTSTPRGRRKTACVGAGY